jgi:hypothetical protein
VRRQEGVTGCRTSRRLISVPQPWGDPTFESVVQHDPIERRTIPNGTEPRTAVMLGPSGEVCG